jgi:hypothetical protein
MLRPTLVVLLLCALASPVLHAQVPDVTSLVGRWKVDVRSAPADDPHICDLVITSVTDSTFVGTFFPDTLVSGTVNIAWDQLNIAFVVRSQHRALNATARFEHGLLKGTLYDPANRRLLMWLGSKGDQ